MSDVVMRDPEFAYLGRFLSWLGRRKFVPAEYQLRVKIRRNERGGFSIYPANEIAARHMGGVEPAGNFASEAEAIKRAHWNFWDVVP